MTLLITNPGVSRSVHKTKMDFFAKMMASKIKAGEIHARLSTYGNASWELNAMPDSWAFQLRFHPSNVEMYGVAGVSVACPQDAMWAFCEIALSTQAVS